MPDVKLNSGSDDVGLKFKIIGISSSQVLPKRIMREE